MTQRSIFVFCLIVLSGISAYSQTRSVTNADLERYKQSRLKAEQEYRENYARLGFPSPEELDRRREESRKETELLSAKLRAERLERERIESEQRAREWMNSGYTQYYPISPDNTIYSGSWYFPSYGGRHRFPVRIPRSFQSGYFAGGHFWPGGLGTQQPPRPDFRIRHPHH